jgi:hypothetical protein
LLGTIYTQDLYMTWMTIPFVPWVVYGLTRTFSEDSLKTQIILGAALAARWWAHAPLTLWHLASLPLSPAGKTCLVDTALQRTVGVVSVRVAAGASEGEILASTFKAITRSSTSFLDHSASARRVLWWHHFLFRQPATVVLRAAERKPTQQYADLDSSARALTHDYGARVLIDASNNSLPHAATVTKREKVLELEPMPRELLEELPELQLLHEALKSANLADVVWMCVGGNPADYKGLLGAWQDQQLNGREAGGGSFCAEPARQGDRA